MTTSYELTADVSTQDEIHSSIEDPALIEPIQQEAQIVEPVQQASRNIETQNETLAQEVQELGQDIEGLEEVIRRNGELQEARRTLLQRRERLIVRVGSLGGGAHRDLSHMGSPLDHSPTPDIVDPASIENSTTSRQNTPLHSDTTPTPRRHQRESRRAERAAISRENHLPQSYPAPYTGKDMDEWREFTQGWDNLFRLKPITYATNETRVAVATSYLRKTPQKRWAANVSSNYQQCPKEWEPFKEFLSNIIQSADVRARDAENEYIELRLQQGESVSQLYSRMLELEKDMPEQTERSRLSTLNRAIRDYRNLKNTFMLFCGGIAPSNVHTWIEKAEQAEQEIAYEKKSQSAKKARPNENSENQGTPSKRPRHDQPAKQNWKNRAARKTSPAPSSGTTSTKTASATPNKTCYTCNGPGHWSGDRRCPKYDEWKTKHPEIIESRKQISALQQAHQTLMTSQRGSTNARESGKGKAKV
jgi:hypothetical protein